MPLFLDIIRIQWHFSIWKLVQEKRSTVLSLSPFLPPSESIYIIDKRVKMKHNHNKVPIFNLSEFLFKQIPF